MSKHEQLKIIHDQIDRESAILEEVHRGRLQCKLGCHECCVDDLTVFELEAERIKRAFKELLRTEDPHPVGKCACLDEDGACRVYAARPYVCRTQGLPLRWIEDEFEYRDICPLNTEGPPVEALEAEQCWTLGEKEIQLAQLQADGRRVSLRSLFTKSADTES